MQLDVYTGGRFPADTDPIAVRVAHLELDKAVEHSFSSAAATSITAAPATLRYTDQRNSGSGLRTPERLARPSSEPCSMISAASRRKIANEYGGSLGNVSGVK